MHYQEYAPSATLAPYIKCFWVLESDDPGPHERERIFPDGSIEWIYHYGDQFHKYTGDDQAILQSRSFFHGQLKRWFELQATGRIGVFGVRFHPAGLHPFIDFDISAITDDTLDSTAIWQDSIERIHAAMFTATTEERLAFAEKFLLEQFQPRKVDQTVLKCVDAIIRDSGAVSIEALADELHTGRRALERRFLAAVGLTPKLLARIVRFNKALQLISDNDFSSFTSVAHEGGFYDQAHFIRDFKDFTGLNPRQYFAENLDLVRFFNL